MKPITLDYDLDCPECGHERDPSQIDANDITIKGRRTKTDMEYLKWAETKNERVA